MAADSVEQLERNVEVSFSYVKKDLLSLNDMISDLYEKIQHLSMNQATLLDKTLKFEGKTIKTSKTEKEELDFYDVKEKKKFVSRDYKIKIIKGRRFAVSVSPSGTESYRILGSATKKKTVAKQKNSTKKKVVKKKVTKKKTSSTKKTPTKPKKIIRETTVF